MARRTSHTDRIIDTALDLAAAKGWRRVSLRDIAEAVGLSLGALHGEFSSRQAIVRAFLDRTDAQVLASLPDASDSTRDRLFDIVMQRFEALNPHKRGVVSMLRAAPFDPLGSLCLIPRFDRSMAWMLEAAGLPSVGLRGRAMAKGLALVYAEAFRAWVNDDTPDMARTMTVLDRALRRAEALIGTCERIAAARPKFRGGEPATA